MGEDRHPVYTVEHFIEPDRKVQDRFRSKRIAIAVADTLYMERGIRCRVYLTTRTGVRKLVHFTP